MLLRNSSLPRHEVCHQRCMAGLQSALKGEGAGQGMRKKAVSKSGQTHLSSSRGSSILLRGGQVAESFMATLLLSSSLSLGAPAPEGPAFVIHDQYSRRLES